MILFRQLNEEVPYNWIAGMHWYIEWHDDVIDRSFPLGIGFCTIAPPEPQGTGPAFLDFLLVADPFRRKGIATAIIEAARKRWPHIQLTGAVSTGGSALLRSLPRTEVELASTRRGDHPAD